MLHLLLVISSALLATSSILLGFFSIVKNRKSRTVQLWFLLSMVIGVWSSVYLTLINSVVSKMSYPLLLVLHTSSLLIPILYLHFVCHFTFSNFEKKFVIWAGYLLFSILAIILYFSDLIIKDIIFTPGFGTHALVTPFYYLYIAYFYFFVGCAIYLLFRAYFRFGGIIRRKVLFVLIASFVGFGGAGTNFLVDAFEIFPYGQLLVWIYPLLITYGIFVDEIKIKIKF